MVHLFVSGTFKNVGTPIKLCYLKTVSTTYNSTSPVLHADGSPTELDLNLTFTEYKPLNRDDFGDTGISATVENIALYADVIDQVADAATSYEDYYIQNGQRMDQVCLDLYDTPEYMFTILLLNKNLREVGWPLPQAKAYERIEF